MVPALNSAISALQAYGTRINSTANNIANSNSEGYKRTRVTFSTMSPGGVKPHVETIDQQGPVLQEETSSGFEFIEQSNVDLSNEIPKMMLDVNYYKANLKTIQTTDEMLSSLLDIKA